LHTSFSLIYKYQEEQMKGKPNWEHLNDELHVLITVEDTKNRAEVKLKRAVEEIKRLLVPAVSSFSYFSLVLINHYSNGLIYKFYLVFKLLCKLKSNYLCVI